MIDSMLEMFNDHSILSYHHMIIQPKVEELALDKINHQNNTLEGALCQQFERQTSCGYHLIELASTSR